MEQIKNSQLTIEVADHGAELVSIKDAHGKEYLWQADPNYWGRHSPILFHPPLCPRLWNGSKAPRGLLFMESEDLRLLVWMPPINFAVWGWMQVA